MKITSRELERIILEETEKLIDEGYINDKMGQAKNLIAKYRAMGMNAGQAVKKARSAVTGDGDIHTPIDVEKAGQNAEAYHLLKSYYKDLDTLSKNIGYGVNKFGISKNDYAPLFKSIQQSKDTLAKIAIDNGFARGPKSPQDKAVLGPDSVTDDAIQEVPPRNDQNLRGQKFDNSIARADTEDKFNNYNPDSEEDTLELSNLDSQSGENGIPYLDIDDQVSNIDKQIKQNRLSSISSADSEGIPGIESLSGFDISRFDKPLNIPKGINDNHKGWGLANQFDKRKLNKPLNPTVAANGSSFGNSEDISAEEDDSGVETPSQWAASRKQLRKNLNKKMRGLKEESDGPQDDNTRDVDVPIQNIDPSSSSGPINNPVNPFEASRYNKLKKFVYPSRDRKLVHAPQPLDSRSEKEKQVDQLRYKKKKAYDKEILNKIAASYDKAPGENLYSDWKRKLDKDRINTSKPLTYAPEDRLSRFKRGLSNTSATRDYSIKNGDNKRDGRN